VEASSLAFSSSRLSSLCAAVAYFRMLTSGMLPQINPTTAYAMLDTLDVPKGEWVLQVCACGVPDEHAHDCACGTVALSLHDAVALPGCSGARMQTAAGSVVGRSTIAIAKQKGVKTISVVRRAEQKQELLDLGYTTCCQACEPSEQPAGMLTSALNTCHPPELTAQACTDS
jgi:hypothetical protein